MSSARGRPSEANVRVPVMRADQAGLFDIPDPRRQAGPTRSQRGRKGEVWLLTATADIVITDASAVLRAAASENEGAVIGTLSPDASIPDDSPKTPDEMQATDPFDALAWLIWPTEGLERALEVGALRILSMDSEAAAVTGDRGRATWRVTAKLTEVGRMRELAVQAHPDQEAEIFESLAVAWERAADPFAPLRSIDGIAWEPGPVVVEHLPARSARLY